jgi:hypothetical protein
VLLNASRSVYDRASEISAYGDRLVACDAASLAARFHPELWQFAPSHTLIHNDIADLNRALNAESKKVAKLFQVVEEGWPD